MHKKTVTFVFSVFVSIFLASAAHAEGVCERKIRSIEKQIAIAKQYNNTDRVLGLQKALRNVNLWCTEEGELAEAEIDVLEKQEKVQEREEELAEAIAEGKGDKKTAKHRQKLEEAKKELLDAEKTRDSLKHSK